MKLQKEKEIKEMKYYIIYRVVGETGPFVSAWVTTKKQAKEIMENLKDNPIFGGDKYRIEENSILL